MANEETIEQESGMRKRRITLADGRYLLFFTFADDGGASSVDDGAAVAARREPEVRAEAEEERGV